MPVKDDCILVRIQQEVQAKGSNRSSLPIGRPQILPCETWHLVVALVSQDIHIASVQKYLNHLPQATQLVQECLNHLPQAPRAIQSKSFETSQDNQD